MGIINREFANNLRDPALNGRFFVRLPFAGDVTGRVFIEVANTPHYKIPALPRFYGGKYYHFPGMGEIDSVALTLFETDDYFITKMFIQWRRQVFDWDTRNYGLPVNYMEDLVIETYDNQQSDSAALEMTYKRCWPTDQNPFELQYGQIEDRLVVTVNLSTDGVDYKF